MLANEIVYVHNHHYQIICFENHGNYQMPYFNYHILF